jgi:hypothetical protein
MTPVDLTGIARDFGLFVAMAVAVILGMGLTIRALWTRLNEQNDGRLSDHKAHAEQMRESMKTLDGALEVVRGVARG